jgi:hypothetical protein
MASLPERERLSLLAAVELIAAETSCEAVAARQALVGGLQDGSIRATGVNDDEELYVPAPYWNREINWTASKLLDWEHIKLSRADLMKWLGQACQIRAEARDHAATQDSVGPEAAPLRAPTSRGPKNGTSGRHVTSDRRLFADMTRLIEEEGEGPYSAARRLIDRLPDDGMTDEGSRIRRVAKRYKREVVDVKDGRFKDGPSTK